MRKGHAPHVCEHSTLLPWQKSGGRRLRTFLPDITVEELLCQHSQLVFVVWCLATPLSAASVELRHAQHKTIAKTDCRARCVVLFVVIAMAIEAKRIVRAIEQHRDTCKHIAALHNDDIGDAALPVPVCGQLAVAIARRRAPLQRCYVACIARGRTRPHKLNTTSNYYLKKVKRYFIGLTDVKKHYINARVLTLGDIARETRNSKSLLAIEDKPPEEEVAVVPYVNLPEMRHDVVLPLREVAKSLAIVPSCNCCSRPYAEHTSLDIAPHMPLESLCYTVGERVPGHAERNIVSYMSATEYENATCHNPEASRG